MAAAAVAGARDATRLESLVCFLKNILYFISLMFILGPLYASKRRWQQQQETLETRQGMEMGLGIKGGSRCVASRALGDFFSVISYYYINMVVYVYILLS